MRDRCLRTVLFHRWSRRAQQGAGDLLLVLEREAIGRQRQEGRPAPDNRHRTRSSGPSPRTRSSSRKEARCPAAAGTGCEDSIPRCARTHRVTVGRHHRATQLMVPARLDDRAIAAAALPHRPRPCVRRALRQRRRNTACRLRRLDGARDTCRRSCSGSTLAMAILRRHSDSRDASGLPAA